MPMLLQRCRGSGGSSGGGGRPRHETRPIDLPWRGDTWKDQTSYFVLRKMGSASIGAGKSMTGQNRKKSKKRKLLLDLESHDCRWPIGEPRHPDFHFCASPQLPGQPYCERHWRIALEPSKQRQATPVGRVMIAKAA